MERKRIAFIVSRFLDGGVETVLLQYLNYLVSLDAYDITLVIGVYTGKHEVYKDRIPKGVKIEYLVKNKCLTWKLLPRSQRQSKIIRLTDEIFINPIRRGLVQYRIWKLGKKNDVIIDFNHEQASFLRSVKCRKIVFFHSSIEVDFRQDPRYIQRLQRKIDAYDCIVTIAKNMQQEAYKIFSRMASRTCMIYNSVDEQALKQLSKVPVADPLMKLPYILIVTRLEEVQKDVTSLIRAYAILRNKYGHKEELFVIGKGFSLGMLQQEARKQQVADHVHFLGFMSNPYPWISQCQLFVQSSKYEGLPTTMIESLLLDKMIVATDCPTGPHEIINDGKAGILTPVGDVEALAKAMHEALTDKALQQRIAQGRAEHKKQFTWEVNGEKFRRLLDGDMPR